MIPIRSHGRWRIDIHPLSLVPLTPLVDIQLLEVSLTSRKEHVKRQQAPSVS